MKLALAGLGHMGVPIGERLLAAGYELTVWNRTKAKTIGLRELGASVGESVHELLTHADVLVTTVADDEALRSVALDALAGARRGTTLIDMSTVSPAASEEVAAAARSAGVDYLRAPVSGNPTVVRAGNLMIIVSGPRGGLERVEPVLKAIGPTLFYVGSDEQARVTKLALQVMIGGTAELMSEALMLAEAGGVDPRILLEVMAESAAGSPFVRYKTAPLLAGDYSATFTTAMMKKDLELVRTFAREHGVPLPLAGPLDDAVSDAIAAGYAELDFMALYLRLRALSGLA